MPGWMRERERLHGVELVDGPAARAVFIDIVRDDLFAAGFVLDRDTRFAKVVSDDIIQLLRLDAFKGRQYSFCWGVSLSFVPHGWKRRLEWHRTVRSARMDLFHRLGDDDSNDDSLSDRRPGEVDGLHGTMALREDMVAAWRQQRERMLDWFEAAASVEDVLTVAQCQAREPGSGPGHWPPPRLVEAFSQARLGRRPEAEAALDDALEGYAQFFEPSERLRDGLAKILAGSTR